MNKFAELTLHVLVLFLFVIFSGCGGGESKSPSTNPNPTPSPTTYSVTVSSAGTGASGGGNYAADATVSIRAGTPPAGQQFKNWVTASAGVSFANENNANTTFRMPSNAVTVTANFCYNVIVSSAGTGATGAGCYVPGETVSINAGTPPAGQRFVNWTTAGVALANANNASTTFTMPINAVTVTANFETPAAGEIWTAAELYNIRNNLSGSYKLMDDISLSVYANWIPIGTESSPFTGRLDGNGKKISGLKINRATDDYTGLFGYVTGGEIVNIILENVDISGGGDAGAIVGLMERGAISGCSVSGKVVSAPYSSAVFSSSGGVAGSIWDGSVISNCHNTAEVIADNDAGGIVGDVYDSTIINSSNSGYILTYLIYSDSAGISGGIAGYVENGAITGCFSTGTVVSESYDSSSTSTAGGIAGGLTYDSLIADSYNAGDIESYSPSSYPGNSVSGGIAGYVWDSAITRSYSLGYITSSSTSGGIAGSSEGYDAIIDCAAINAAISAVDDAGRIVGYIYFPETSEITNNFALAGMAASGLAVFDVGDIQRHGVGKTDAQLRQQSTYSGAVSGNGLGGLGWGFGFSDASPWRMASGGYPFLYWE